MAFGADSDTEWIELKPITLLFGRNSSGKSVVIRALRLLKQSLTNAPSDSPFAFRVEDGVDVGSYYEMVHGQNIEKEVSFGFRFNVSPGWLKNFQGNEDLQPDENVVDLTLGFRWNGVQQRVVLVLLLCEAPRSAIEGENRRCIFRAERLSYDFPDDAPENWHYDSDFLVQHESPDSDNIWRFVIVNLNSGFLPWLNPWLNVQRDSQYYYEKSDDWGDDFGIVSALLKYFRTAVINFFKNIEYVRPIRPEPKRFFVLDEEKQRHWRQLGLSAYLKFVQGKIEENEYNDLGRWFQHLQLGLSVFPEEQSKKPEIARLTELHLDEGVDGLHKVNLIDIGFGASQVIPVVIQSILAKENSLVIIEQPELHLHPRAQAQLADLFVEMSRKGVRFLIETHSEHLFLRLRRWIAETTFWKKKQSSKTAHKGEMAIATDKVNPNRLPVSKQQHLDVDEFRAYFVHREKAGSIIGRLGIDPYGEMITMPAGYEDFFSDDLIESANLMRIRLEEEASKEHNNAAEKTNDRN
jgi:energy-coupling factor transporter ATP-binding protein EcfA2